MTSEPHRKEIAEDRNRADGSIDEEVQAHPCHNNPRHVKSGSQYQHDGPDEIGQYVTESRYKSEQWVKPHIKWCAGNFDGRVKNLR